MTGGFRGTDMHTVLLLLLLFSVLPGFEVTETTERGRFELKRVETHTLQHTLNKLRIKKKGKVRDSLCLSSGAEEVSRKTPQRLLLSISTCEK